MSIRKKIIKNIMILSSFAILFCLGLTYYLSSNYLYYSRHKPYTVTPEKYGYNFQNIKFKSRSDQVNLKGWFIESDSNQLNSSSGRPVIILVHGHNSNMGEVSHVDQIGHIASPLLDTGFSTFSIDLRNHGESGDLQPISMGFHERKDVLGAVDYLKANAAKLNIDVNRIGVWGKSMGAATAIHAAAVKENDDHSIKALFVDSPFARSIDPIYLRLKNDNVNTVLQDMIVFWIRKIPELDIATFNPEEQLKYIQSPIYFVHSENDAVVEAKDSKRMYEVYKEKNPHLDATLWLTQASKHVYSAKEYTKEYKKRLVEFFKSHLKI